MVKEEYLKRGLSCLAALIFAQETQQGRHTAKSGLFLRDFPGRLVLYPLEAATCAVIFFSGDWYDAGVAAIAGFACGLVEYLLSSIGGDAKALIDVLVGTTVGAIGGLFYRFGGEQTCLPAIFLGKYRIPDTVNPCIEASLTFVPHCVSYVAFTQVYFIGSFTERLS